MKVSLIILRAIETLLPFSNANIRAESLGISGRSESVSSQMCRIPSPLSIISERVPRAKPVFDFVFNFKFLSFQSLLMVLFTGVTMDHEI
jgi:hypothetical protein